VTYGLLIIAISWLVLVARYYRGHHGFYPWFLRLYVIGALIIFLDNFHGASLRSALTLVGFLAPLYILWKTGR